jgi:hypothetical protein
MTDMNPTIIPKSDQMNADDLIGGPRTIQIRDVKLFLDSEQPCAVYYHGDNGKPYLPCKSMRRVMVHIWGPDAAAYIGRSMTLYRDPDVTWGGMAVGGIRISHMSDLDDVTMVVLTATKKTRKPFKVMPLALQPEPINATPPAPKRQTWAELVAGIEADAADLADEQAVIAFGADPRVKKVMELAKQPVKDEVSRILGDAYNRTVEANMQRADEPLDPLEDKTFAG